MPLLLAAQIFAIYKQAESDILYSARPKQTPCCRVISGGRSRLRLRLDFLKGFQLRARRSSLYPQTSQLRGGCSRDSKARAAPPPPPRRQLLFHLNSAPHVSPTTCPDQRKASLQIMCSPLCHTWSTRWLVPRTMILQSTRLVPRSMGL